MPPRPPLPVNPYRLFHLSARLRLRDRPTTPSPPSSQPTPADDYYALLLSTPSPTPHPVATKTISSTLPPAPPQPSSTAAPRPTTTPNPATKILFGRDADTSGPSPKARGLERAAKGLERPPEPDNCCMSGCVHCVWDAYREEVEGWAAARRQRDSDVAKRAGEGSRAGVGEEIGGLGEGDEGSGVADVDGVGGFEGWGAGGGEEGEDALFEGVPVGIREFMKQEKRIRERRGEDAVERSYEGRNIESWRVDTKREEKRA
ncbi:hypothetical protein N7G274_000643 [Stereocaulon virgatum]|uniref:Oxidoreductase-like domain-containing protein n=1 Tax=Stereocaulon virgatum TaxID=373712 RepID=A0ABR4ARX3_9LECA